MQESFRTASVYNGLLMTTVANRFFPSAFFFHSLLVIYSLHAIEPQQDGREILKNGDLLQDAERTVHWVTRDSGNLGKFELLPPEAEGGPAILAVTVNETSSKP